jgi:hypothetical protein
MQLCFLEFNHQTITPMVNFLEVHAKYLVDNLRHICDKPVAYA